MTDPIRESVAKRLYPEAWYFAGSDEDKCAALAKADYAIRAVTGALEAQGYVVVPREPTEAMLKAGDDVILTDEEFHSGPFSTLEAEWRAMVAAIKAGA